MGVVDGVVDDVVFVGAGAGGAGGVGDVTGVGAAVEGVVVVVVVVVVENATFVAVAFASVPFVVFVVGLHENRRLVDECTCGKTHHPVFLQRHHHHYQVGRVIPLLKTHDLVICAKAIHWWIFWVLLPVWKWRTNCQMYIGIVHCQSKIVNCLAIVPRAKVHPLRVQHL